MPLYRIEPNALPGDTRWQDRTIWKEVIVRAPNTGFARLLATNELERDPDQPPVGNESLTFGGGFQDAKLYWIRELSPEEAAAFGAEGPDGVLRAVRWEETPAA